MLQALLHLMSKPSLQVIQFGAIANSNLTT